MFCSICGGKQPDDECKFCWNCGKKIISSDINRKNTIEIHQDKKPIKESNKKTLFLFIICLCLITLFPLIIMRFITKNPFSSTNYLSPQEIIHTITSDINLNLIESEKGEENTDGYLWWITDDDYNIQMVESPNVIFKVKVASDFGSMNKLNYIIQQPYNKNLTDSIEKLLKNYGFNKNDKNSSKNEYDNTFYNYILAYQKDDVVCTWTLDPDIYNENSYNFLKSELICSDELEKSYIEQKPLIDAFQLKNEQAAINITKEIDDFYYISVRQRISGYHIIAKKNDGEYIKIYEGQFIMPCDKVNEFNVPKYIYGECLPEIDEEITYESGYTIAEVRYRVLPSDSADIIDTISIMSPIEVNWKNQQNNFTQVRFNKNLGWIMTKFISKEYIAPSSFSTLYYCFDTDVRIRKGNSTNFSILESIDYGDALLIDESKSTNTWKYVYYPDKPTIGYVMAIYLTKN